MVEEESLEPQSFRPLGEHPKLDPCPVSSLNEGRSTTGIMVCRHHGCNALSSNKA